MVLVSSKKLLKDQKGASLVEYALIACCVAIVALAGVTVVGDEVSGTFEFVGKRIEDAGRTEPPDGGCKPGDPPPC